ncbi:MAG TPA: dienelactone hydrolase family protein [Dehalococcoidia bacterium]
MREVYENPFGDDEGAAEDLELSIQRVAVADLGDGSFACILHTSRGELHGRLHPCEGETGAVVMVSGATGGLDGPADAIYDRLGRALVERGVTTLRLHYRLPGQFEECVLDVLGGVSFLRGIGADRVALVGHSFGGAVVIKAAEISPAVAAVAALSSQLYGTRGVASIAPRPLLLVHGMEDQVLEATASEVLYNEAQEPKRLVLYAEAGHSLIQARDQLYDLLVEWIPQQVRGAA